MLFIDDANIPVDNIARNELKKLCRMKLKAHEVKIDSAKK
jgi:hypothetical protein